MLCNECSLQNGPLILRQGWSWQEEIKDGGWFCDNCHCTDKMVRRHGRFRWIYCWIFTLLPWSPNRRRKAMLRRK
ncbi:MAG: hypothetical protein OEL55_00125 [Desulfobulbaceae bacterium]|nr:hypothetical protein [Desulfobulbaceae bacterium]